MLKGRKGNMLRLPEVVGAKRQMLVATYNDVYAKKNGFKTPEPFETAVEFSSSLPYFPFRRPFWLLPPLLLFNAECSELFFLELL